MNIILASTSPRRIEMFRWLGVKFKTDNPQIDEKKIRDKNPVRLAKKLAKAKAEDVSKRYSEGIVIGSDTVIQLGNHIIEKPKDKKDQKRLIKLLTGKEIVIISAVYFKDLTKNRTICRIKKTPFLVKRLSKDQIESYIKSGKGLDKGGGFGIQDNGGMFIEKIKGCYPNSIGFPICTVSKVLKSLGVEINVNIKNLVKEKTGHKC